MADGCRRVLKPSELTPLSALTLAVPAERAEVSAGAFSVITTTGADAFGLRMTKNETVAKISFSGSPMSDAG